MPNLSTSNPHENDKNRPGIRVRVIARFKRPYLPWVVLRHIRCTAVMVMQFIKREGIDRGLRYIEAVVSLLESKAEEQLSRGRRNDAEARNLDAKTEHEKAATEHQKAETDRLKVENAAALWKRELAQADADKELPVLELLQAAQRLRVALALLKNKGGMIRFDYPQLKKLANLEIPQAAADSSTQDVGGAQEQEPVDAPESSADRRRHKRYPLEGPVFISRDGTQVMRRADDGNISESGLYARLPLDHRSPADGWRAGQPTSVHIENSQPQSPDEAASVPMDARTGKVIRTRIEPGAESDPDCLGIAIEFDEHGQSACLRMPPDPPSPPAVAG